MTAGGGHGREGSGVPGRAPGGGAPRWRRELLAGPPSVRAMLGGRITTPGAVVPAYHDVAPPGGPTDDYRLAPERFGRHLDLLAAWGLTVVPLTEIVARLESGRPVDGLAAVTFDDALVGVLECAAPAIAARGLSATVFANPGSLGGPHPGWPDARPTVTAGQLRELVACGFAVGSHGVTHRPLPSLGRAEQAAELLESRARLEDLTGTVVDLFAYPEGRHDETSRAAVEDAGYRAAFGFAGGRVLPGDHRFALARVCMHRRQGRVRLARDLARPAAAWPRDPYLAGS